MVSGSGLYPPRLLDMDWFTEEEKKMIAALETLLQGTGHARTLALDMMTPRLYDIKVKIILDNSGSMSLDMMGENIMMGGIDGKAQFITVAGTRYFSLDEAYRAIFTSSQSCCSQTCCCCAGSCGPNGPCPPQPVPQRMTDGLDPRHRRWFFARDHLNKWLNIYRTMNLEVPVYLLNPTRDHQAQRPGGSIKVVNPNLNSLFENVPGGTTPLTEVLANCLNDHLLESKGVAKPLLVLVLTDGEANNKNSFNTLLDSIQWYLLHLLYFFCGQLRICFLRGAHGDVQVCVRIHTYHTYWYTDIYIYIYIYIYKL
jgi:hypothetical protein